MFYHTDPNNYAGSDAERIEQAIKETKAKGFNKIIIPPYNAANGKNLWVIDRAIKLPSDITVVLDNCYMVQADGIEDNMFINENLREPIGRTKDGTQRNITIMGIGNPVLDGGNYNGLSERTSLKDGRKHISYNNMILFANVQGFKITNISVKNQRWWALDFLYCSNGYLGNIDFKSDTRWIDDNGNIYNEPKPEFGYGNIYIKNSDGIDLRCGCNNIVIENITGYTQDDTIALTCIYGDFERMYEVKGSVNDLHNVIIRNVTAKTICAIVRLLNQGGTKLYNILIDGIYDSSYDPDYKDTIYKINRGHAVRIGDNHLYGSSQNTLGDTYNITVQNIAARCFRAVAVAGCLKDSLIRNVKTFDCEGTQGECCFGDAQMENVKVEL